MRATRKEYGFDYSSVVEPSFLDVDSVTFNDPVSEKTKTVRASDFVGPAQITRPLLTAFYRMHDGRRLYTVAAVITALNTFLQFLGGKPIQSIEEIDREVMVMFRHHLAVLVSEGKINGRTPHSIFMHVQAVLIEALRLRGVPYRKIDNPFPGVGRASKPREHLEPNDLRKLLSAAKKDVAEIWRGFSVCDLKEESPHLRRAMQHVLETRDGVLWRYKTDPQYSDLRTLFERCGGLEVVARRFHATRDSLIPYLILLSYWTAANIESLIKFQRDCLVESLIPGSFEIHWQKGRASGEQVVVLTDSGRFSAPVLIRQVLAMTEPLIPHVGERYRNALFLCRPQHPQPGQEHGVFTQQMYSSGLREFCDRHRLAFKKVNFAMMRPSVLAEAYRKTGDLLAVSRFANHRRLHTTIRYVVDRITDEKHDALIARSQGRFYKRLMSISSTDAQVVAVKASSTVARGVANDCRDPFDPPSTAAQCPAWLWPFNDPGLVIPNNPKNVAEVIRVRNWVVQTRALMHPKRFSLLYAALLHSIEEALSRFDEPTLSEAERLAATLGPLPEAHHE